MGEQTLPKKTPHLHNREDKPTEASMMVEKSTSPSVAKLAGKFQDQPSLSGTETLPIKPTRRKPPCSLPLNTHKPEPGENGELKPSSNASHALKGKVKSSPLIEKLQANLAFSPMSLLPGPSPKSPGLKVMVSPFNSPPSTPLSPQSHSSDPDETPVSFDQPPEGTHLQFYNKVRSRGSIKRRPPSRRFRKSQSEYGDDLDLAMAVSSQENGAKDDNKLESVFTDKSKAVDGIDHCEKESEIVSDKTPSDLQSGRKESRKSEGKETGEGTLCKDSQEEKPHKNLSKLKPCEKNKEEKEKNPDLETVLDIKRKSWKSTLRDREEDNTSDQEKKGKRENKSHVGEGTQELSDTKETETPQQGKDTETVENSRV